MTNETPPMLRYDAEYLALFVRNSRLLLDAIDDELEAKLSPNPPISAFPAGDLDLYLRDLLAVLAALTVVASSFKAGEVLGLSDVIEAGDWVS